jgi:UDP-glucose 4-epimerase
VRVAVVGGAGFIGSHIVDALNEAGHDVTVVDIVRPHRADVRHVAADIGDPERATVALAGGFDAVYLLAAVANVGDVYRIPAESVHTNVTAVAHVLDSARRAGVGRVILASTTWVYELAEQQEVDEETPLRLDRTNHVYTASKLSAEMLCHAYRVLYGLDTTILRYGVPYGPRARTGTVLATFVQRAHDGEPIVVHGDGTQWRSFVHVEDLARGNVAALQDAARNQTYNLDGTERVTIREIVELVRAFFPDLAVRQADARPGDLRPRVVSSRKALVDLGWKPRVSFREGATRYIASLAANGRDGRAAPAALARPGSEAA